MRFKEQIAENKNRKEMNRNEKKDNSYKILFVLYLLGHIFVWLISNIEATSDYTIGIKLNALLILLFLLAFDTFYLLCYSIKCLIKLVRLMITHTSKRRTSYEKKNIVLRNKI